LAVLTAVAGCSKSPDEPPARVKTGAEEVAQAFFEALANKDWPSAYQALDPQSTAKLREGQFAALAQQYYDSLGFEPTEVHVQSCDERGDEAVAHVNLKGLAGSSARFHKDAVALRRSAGKWRVVLPDYFGKPTATTRKS
jgi:hypothetical protein